MSFQATDPCLCGRADARGRPLPFARCCGLYLSDFDRRPAPDAHALMRSRYCAFVLQDGPYLLATWHASQRPGSLDFEPGVKWLGLEVRAHEVLDADHAVVEFVARSRHGGRAQRLHERSRFLRGDGRWFYFDGDML